MIDSASGAPAIAVRPDLASRSNVTAILDSSTVQALAVDALSLPSNTGDDTIRREVATSAGVELTDIVRMVERDSEFGTRVLQIVNSATFGTVQRITSIQQAAVVLGLDELRSLVLVAQVIGGLESLLTPGISLPRFQRYAMRSARLVREAVPDELATDAFCAGALHDVGKLVLAAKAPEKFEQARARYQQANEPAHKVERDVIGASHAEVGAFLLSHWGIAPSIVEAVAYHHTPSKITSGDRHLLAAVHAVDTLIGVCACNEPASGLDLPFLAAAGVMDQLPRWRASVEEECKRLLVLP